MLPVVNTSLVYYEINFLCFYTIAPALSLKSEQIHSEVPYNKIEEIKNI
jgi:hypothetical protein